MAAVAKRTGRRVAAVAQRKLLSGSFGGQPETVRRFFSVLLLSTWRFPVLNIAGPKRTCEPGFVTHTISLAVCRDNRSIW